MVVSDIIQYKLVPAPEFPDTARYISALQEMGLELVLQRFRNVF